MKRPGRVAIAVSHSAEVDYMLGRHVGAAAELAFLHDVAEARYSIERGNAGDLIRAKQLAERYKALEFGLVDAVVMAIAERLEADAIATLDVRHFGAVKLRNTPALWPRDL
jgi:uncharacterized protein